MNPNPDQLKRVSVLFDELHGLSANQRAERLAELAAAEPEVAAELARWLQKDDESVGLLDVASQRFAAAGGVVEDAAASDRSGQRIGPYQLQRRVGRGGMGEVYEAHRPGSDFEQRVAVKLLRRGLDSDDIVRRFLRERRILARLEHPSIARLIDGGVSDDGQPYLVMEFVEGQSLIDGVNAAALDLGARLKLFVQTCDAVAYAHRRLIVHRDLKPSNVLLGADQQPKLLDFGIAKLLDEVDDEPFTGTGTRVLTPGYAAPEQILGQPISTATDVYALGLILYELLTGTSAHQRKGKDLDRVIRDLDQESVIRPSAVLLKEQSAGHSTHSQRLRLARQLTGDIDTIVLHALKREPERRYQGAAELADDIRRHINGHPVRAQTDTLRYRMAKFVRRHRGGVTAAALAILSIVGGLGVALWQAQVAHEKTKIAQAQTDRAERVKSFLISLFAETEGTTRESAALRTPLQLVTDGIGRAQTELAEDPALLDSVLGDLLDIKINLGGAPEALPLLDKRILFRRQRNPLDESLAVALSSKVTVLFQQGKFADAEPLIAEALAIYRTHYPDEHLRIADMQNRQVRVLLSRSQYQEALALMQQVVAKFEQQRGQDDPDLGMRLSNLAVLQLRTNDVDGARMSLQRSLTILEKTRGMDHAQLLFPLSNLGDLYRREGRNTEALAAYQRVLSITREQLGDNHFQTGDAWGRVGDMQRRLRQLDSAQTSLETSLVIAEQHQGNELADTYARLGELAVARNQPEAAAAWFLKAHEFSLKSQGDQQVLTWEHLASVAQVRAQQGDYAIARSLLHQAIDRLSGIAGVGQLKAAIARFTLGTIERDAGKLDLAIELMRDAQTEVLKLLPDSDPRRVVMRAHLAAALALRGAPADADEGRQLLGDIAEALPKAGAETQSFAAFAAAQLGANDEARRVALLAWDTALEQLGSDGNWLRKQRERFN